MENENIDNLIEEISIEKTIQTNINFDKLENLVEDEVNIENVYYKD